MHPFKMVMIEITGAVIALANVGVGIFLILESAKKMQQD